MKTRIDAAIADFVMNTIDHGLELECTQRLLDFTREQFGLDVVYILERVNAEELYTYKCVSFSNSEYDMRGVFLRVPAAERDMLLHMYDDGPVCDYNLPSIASREEFSNCIIHYGFVRQRLHSYDGSIGFQIFSPHDWTMEEREALRKLGTAYKAFISVTLAEGVDESLFQWLKQEQAQYRNALVKGCLYSIPFDITDGLIREQIVTAHGIDIVSAVGLSLPASYDEMNAEYMKKHEVRFLDDAMKDCLTCAGLLRRFGEGMTSPDWEYYQPDADLFVRVTVYMYQEPVTGHIHGLLISSDITEARKQQEKQRQALRAAYDAANQANDAKTRFLSNMSHDIRTPMNGIIGMTAIAGAYLDDRKRVEDCLAKITVASKHLLGIINEVLDMSKIESGKVELQDEAFGLPDLIEQLLVLSRPMMEEKEHTFSVSLKDIEHEQVIGDSQRLQQVFMNFLSNAAKYTPKGGTIGLTVTEKPSNRGDVACYEFIFEDNGIGMSDSFQEHLFEPFSREEDNRVRQIQGTGLGMTITKTIVQMMNGDIKVQSRVNEGTKFIVTIFLKIQDADEISSYERFVELPVLVADDDETAGEYTCMMLTELGMRGEYVLTGQEALQRVVDRQKLQQQYFAVILDWKMPGMDGIETAKQIRRQVGSEVPIIILSAYDWSTIELEARAAGVSAFISKPLFKSRLAHLFHDLLEPKDNADAAAGLEQFQKEDYSGRRALLVEDNELNAEIAGEILEMAGLSVEYAKDGQEAVSMVVAGGDGHYDIIFMDIQMPVMNGYDATKAIRALSGKYIQDMPIIAMTANAFSEDVLAAKSAGMNEHIAKPIDLDRLFVTLNHWLGKESG